MQRRQFLATVSSLLCAQVIAETLPAAAIPLPQLSRKQQARWTAAMQALETESGGRLGVAVLDIGTGRQLGWRTDERFAMCSTFKFLLGAVVLAHCDQKKESLARVVPIAAKDLLQYAPFSKTRVGASATVAELCQAMLTLSDNTAANLLLAGVGGPMAVTGFVRTLGDRVTRLDRYEPALNDSSEGDDPRDTTAPGAMVATMRQILLGEVLQPASRQQLIDWMIACQTGDQRLRAGLPKDWKAGDKTGTGAKDTATNDIAIIWPTPHAPILVASYLTQAKVSGEQQDRILAKVGAAVAQMARAS